ncbi:Homeobox domain protein [Raphanus sativus]|nr:Homeobox domain protein [Raphanus sativus]
MTALKLIGRRNVTNITPLNRFNEFQECPHPDDKQRNQLSRELGLAPRQIKFWFNRRTQLKAQHERAYNNALRSSGFNDLKSRGFNGLFSQIEDVRDKHQKSAPAPLVVRESPLRYNKNLQLFSFGRRTCRCFVAAECE